MVVVIIWIFNFLDIRDAIDSVDSEFVSGSVGYGMWVMAVGGVVALAGILNLPASTEPEGSGE